MNSWLPSMRCPDRSATARALEIASDSPITVNASAIGASVCHVRSVISGIDSGGTADGNAPIVGTCAMPRRDSPYANTAPSTMPVSMYGTRGNQRLPAIAVTQREYADGEHGDVRLVEVRQKIADAGDEACFLRDVDAEEIAKLRADDQQARAGGEADDHGRRDEIDERAEPRDARARA